jgi:ketosteroid isomerase-like protein
MSGVDEQVRAAILRSMEAAGRGDADASHEIYAEDAVLEFPQSGELFVGKQNFLAWRRIYPGEVEFVVRGIRGGGALWVRELSVRYDGGEVAVRRGHPRVPQPTGGA